MSRVITLVALDEDSLRTVVDEKPSTVDGDFVSFHEQYDVSWPHAPSLATLQMQKMVLKELIDTYQSFNCFWLKLSFTNKLVTR